MCVFVCSVEKGDQDDVGNLPFSIILMILFCSFRQVVNLMIIEQ